MSIGSNFKNIAISSGKGGTGKTTYALSLAWTLGNSEEFELPITLLDCDVEEPNCHLFINAKPGKTTEVRVPKPVFDMELCDGCGICAEQCRYNAIAVVKGTPMAFEDMCHSCDLCKYVCPQNAISMKETVIGKILSSFDNAQFAFAYGKLNVGAVQSPDIITKLQEKFGDKAGVNLFDSPPGTACNAVQTLENSDTCILITEPTPFGANDLSLALDLTSHMGIKSSIVINRSETSSDNIIDSMARKHGVPVVGRIPFSREYAEACSKGLILAAEFPGLRHEIINSFSRTLSEATVPVRSSSVFNVAATTDKLLTGANTSKSSNFTELTVLSGKGGTGKTTVTAAFADLAPKLSAADSDVDAANLSLVMKGELLGAEAMLISNKAIVDQDKCTKCNKCLELCRFGAIEKSKGSYHVIERKCEGCGLCVELCPAKAITEYKAETGYIMASKGAKGVLAHARLTTAAENSGMLVSKVRELAFSLANEHKSEWLLVDGPPGIACPAIATVTGTDRVVLVTEPTVAAVHDLERVMKLVKHFGINPEIIINKADINLAVVAQIKDLAKAQQCRVLGEIPFDENVKESIKAGVAITQFGKSEAGNALKAIWKTIEETQK